MVTVNWAQLLIAVAVISALAGWQFGRKREDLLPCQELVQALPVFWTTPGCFLRMMLLYILAVVGLFLLLTGMLLLLLPGFPEALLAGLVVTWLVLVMPGLRYGTDCLRGYLQRHVFCPSLPSPAELALVEEAVSPLPRLFSRLEQEVQPATVSAIQPAPVVARQLSTRLRIIAQKDKRDEIEALINPLINGKRQQGVPLAIVRDDRGQDLVQAELLGMFLASLAVVRYAQCCAERERRAAEVRRFFEPDTDKEPARPTTIS